jgi:hypothetical protein
MNLKDLSAAFTGVDFTVPYQPHDTSYSINDYVLEFLQKTFDIIMSSLTIKNSVIVNFVNAGIKDHRLPYTAEYLIRTLKCSETEAEDFLLAQSAFFAVSFEPQEYKNLGPLDFTFWRTLAQIFEQVVMEWWKKCSKARNLSQERPLVIIIT